MSDERRFQLSDQVQLLRRSLDDLDAELAEGEIAPEEHARLAERDRTKLAEAQAALAALGDEEGATESAQPPRARRRRRWLLVVGFSGIAIGALGLAYGALSTRDPGATSGGQAQLNADQQVASDLATASSYVAAGDLGRAVSKYSEVLRIRPRNVEALSEFGWLTYLESMRAGDAKAAAGAQPFLERAIVLDPNNPAPRLHLGILLLELRKDPKAAVVQFDQFLALKPAPVQLQAAATYLKQAYAAVGRQVPTPAS